jgi:transposase
MKALDARSLPAAAQEALRTRAVAAVRTGMQQTEAAQVFGVTRQSVNKWVKAWEAEGTRALKAKRRGRPPRTRLALHQAALIVRLIVGRCPDQLRLPFALWTREAVQQLIATKCRLRLSVWTVGRYLKRWGLTPQKPRRRAFEQDPVAVRRWLTEEYPAIRRAAKAAGAELHWGDEMGLRSDHQTGTSYGRKGQTPVIPGTGKRFRCNVLSTITNRGRLAFMVFRESFTNRVFLRFLRRLLRHVRRPVFLILDRHPVHLAAAVQRWVARRPDQLRLCFLPGYSPDLNPDEFLNHDVKSNALGRRRPRDAAELVSSVRSYLRSTQRQPAIVQSYFHAPSVQYAAL